MLICSPARRAPCPPHPAWQCRLLSEEAPPSRSDVAEDGSLIFYGSVQFNLDNKHSLFRAMPPVLQARSLMATESTILPLLDALTEGTTSHRVGAAGMAARLVDVLAMRIIRSWVEHGCQEELGWTAAARHPRIGLALAAIHERPDEHWSVGRLASQAGMSRSAFAAAFAAGVGDTPTRYLTEMPMYRARAWIGREGMRIAEVAPVALRFRSIVQPQLQAGGRRTPELLSRQVRRRLHPA